MADAIRQAVTMPIAERVQRMESLHSVVKSRNIFGWASGIVGTLIEIRELKHNRRHHAWRWYPVCEIKTPFRQPRNDPREGPRGVTYTAGA